MIKQHRHYSASLLVALVTIFTTLPLLGQSLSTEAFFRFDDFDGIKISPDGKHLAMAVPKEDNGALAIMDVESNEIVSQFDTPKNQKIGEFHWANNERILFTTLVSLGGLDAPFQTGDIFALNIDGTRKFKLAGPGPGDIAAYGISNMLLGDDDTVRVVRAQVRRRSVSRSRPSSFLMNINSTPESITKRSQANLRAEVRSPLPWGNLHSDRAGNVRVATAMSDERNMQVHYRLDDDSGWIDISTEYSAEGDDSPVVFLDFDMENESFFLLKNTDFGTTSLVQYFPETRQTEIIYQNPNFDISPIDLVLSNKRDAILGVKFIGDVLETHYFGSHPDIDIHKSLDAAFPGEKVSVTSSTRDGSKAVIQVAGPQRAGTYYIMDTAAIQLTQIGEANSMLPKEQMVSVQPFVIQSRDGLDLHGVVTLPNTESANQAMIVIPHGGPIGIRDDISF